MIGNSPVINANGERFLEFLSDTVCRHINGACRVQGQWSTRLTKGLWTRQRGHSSSIIDYGVVSIEHLYSVKSLLIDDEGKYGGGSDHNWLFLSLEDRFVKQDFVSFAPKKPTKVEF